MKDREARIRSLLPLVKRVAKRLNRLIPAFDLDDLVGDGCIGLIRAVDAFDPARGTSLERYARKSILGAMLNGIRRMDPISERTRRTVRDAESVRYAVAAWRGSLPNDVEIEEYCPGYARALVTIHSGRTLSLDAPLPDRENRPYDAGSDPARLVEWRSDRAALIALVDALPKRQRSVVLQHYFAGRSLRTIGKDMAISPQRASQLHVAALRRMRRTVHAAQR